jgi:acetyl esterase/lipase
MRYAGTATTPLELDAFLPAVKTPIAGVLVVHGGGWTAGSRRSVDLFAQRLAEVGFDAFSIDYRLAPRHPFPAALRDVEASISWLYRHRDGLHLAVARLGLLGFSAGGNLALDAALIDRARYGSRRVGAVVAWSAPTDLARFLQQTRNAYAMRSIRSYMGCLPQACLRRYGAASPVTHVARGDAPMFLVNSSHEIVPLAQARELVHDARRVQVPVTLLVEPGGRHAAEYASEAWRPTVSFFRRYLQ